MKFKLYFGPTELPLCLELMGGDSLTLDPLIALPPPACLWISLSLLGAGITLTVFPVDISTSLFSRI